MKEYMPAMTLPLIHDWKKNYISYPMIQYFIAYKTLGTVWYRGIAFDLHNYIDREILGCWLVADGTISVTQRPTGYPFNTNYDLERRYTVYVPEYMFIRDVETRFFWLNMLERLLPQLTPAELIKFNKERKRECDEILQHQTDTLSK